MPAERPSSPSVAEGQSPNDKHVIAVPDTPDQLSKPRKSHRRNSNSKTHSSSSPEPSGSESEFVPSSEETNHPKKTNSPRTNKQPVRIKVTSSSKTRSADAATPANGSPNKKRREPGASKEMQRLISLSRSLHKVAEDLREKDAKNDELLFAGRDAMAHMNAELKSRRKDLRALKKEYTSREETLSRENRELTEQLERRTKYCEKLQISVQSYAEEVQNDPHNYEKITDDQIHSLWQSLAFDIQQLVLSFLKERPEGTTRFNRGSDSTFRVEVAKECNETPWLSRFILQRYIWTRLLKDVFHPGQSIWSGDIGQSFMGFCRLLEESAFNDPENGKVYSTIKSSAAHELDHAFGSDEDAIEKLAQALADDVLMFSTPENSEHIRQGMIEIIKKAVKLQVIFLKSKALFRLIQNPFQDIEGKLDVDLDNLDDKFDVHYTHEELSKADRKVYLFSPRLEKCGNSDGHDGSFEKHTVICLPRAVIG